MLGFSVTFCRNDEVRAAIMIGGAQFGCSVLETTDLAASPSGTAETVTAPSCEARAPMPCPISSSGTVTIAGFGIRIESSYQDQNSYEHQQQAEPDHPPG
jgi:hypothetical protein